MLEVPQCLLQLLEDYTSQALDAARDISDEFEGEMVDLLKRATRIRAVLKVIRDCESECRLEGSSATRRSASEDFCRTLTRAALLGLGKMSEELTGVPVVVSVAAHVDTPSYGLRPLGRPTSLAEAALELFAQNTKVVFRRTGKRPRDGGTHEGGAQQIAPPGSVFSRLAAEQKKGRLALYSARTALFSRAISSPALAGKDGRQLTSVFVPPAVRDFAALNVEAECEMLAAFYCVDTKAQLLRELPTLQNAVEQFRESLRAAGVVFDCSNRADRGGQLPWFDFPFTAHGVVQMVVRRSLVINITWDPLQGGRWRVLSLHWLLRVQTLPDILLLRPSIAGASGGGGALRAHPAHYEATVRYLSNCFETGLESGCMGALRLVNSVVMEAVETQCRALRETFFVGPLESSFVLDARPGTHIACTLLPPATGTGPAQGGTLHVKYTLCMGTVVVEIRRGTDTRTTRQFDFYAGALGDADPSVVVVDVERLLWQFFLD